MLWICQFEFAENVLIKASYTQWRETKQLMSRVLTNPETGKKGKEHRYLPLCKHAWRFLKV